MRSTLPPLPTMGALLAVAALTLTLTGCSLPEADGNNKTAAKPAVELTFAYTADGGDGFIDQTLTITNNGAAAGAPDLDIVPLDASGATLDDVEVVTAFGSDTGAQVVPAYTEVIDVLKFKGEQAADVADVKVTVTDPGTLDGDYPSANDLQVKRYDISGKPQDDSTLGSVLIKNPYDVPITIDVVGIQFADAVEGEPMHFKQVSKLVGPLTLQPGEKLRQKIPIRYRVRFFGSVRAYLVP